MFRLLGVGDLHLTIRSDVPKEWQIHRYKEFIDNLVSDCKEQPTILALLGDTLNTAAPNKEELQLFMYLMHQLNKEDITTLLVSGNHETLAKGSSILDYLGVSEFSNVYYRRNFYAQGVTFHLVNHDVIHTYKPELGLGLNVLLSHARCDVDIHIKEEIDFKKFTKPYNYCFLGDIHHTTEFDNVWYTNNPINKEFEAAPNCGMLVVDFVEGNSHPTVARRKLVYPYLMYKKINVSEWCAKDYVKKHFYKVEVAGTPEELRTIKEVPPNVKLCKVPVLPSVYKEDEPDEEVRDDLGVDAELLAYLKSMNYKPTLINAMMDELRRT